MPTKIFILGLLAWIPFLPATTLGQTSNGKVAVLNYSAVIRESSEGKRLFAEFEKIVTSKRTEFEQKTNEISTLQRQLVEQAASLNPDAQRTLTQNIDSKNTQLKRDQEDAQKEFGARQQQIVRQIASKLRPVVDKYAQEQKISLIVNFSQEVFFLNPAIEITQEIIVEFNNSTTTSSTSGSQ